MAIWLVTRHQGAFEWLQQQGIVADHIVSHLEVTALATGDSVIGILPFHLAAYVCERGGRFWSLDVVVPAEWRGHELSADQLTALGACLTEYRVQKIVAKT
ncbi:CRISPR-associated protein Csx16 [Aquaspirillum soli]